MSISGSIKGNLAYSKELLDSGIAGAKDARAAVLGARENTDMLTAAVQESWQGAAIGVLAGAIVGALADDREPVRGVVAGGILGAVLGFGCSLAWKTRPLTSAMAREAGRRVGTVRDQHWLTRHPVNYG
jgi:hypothetical protein